MSLGAQVEKLHGDFPQFLEANNEFTHGTVTQVRDAHPSTIPYRNFCSLNLGKHVMGIMFHGTSRSCIAPICRDGINRHFIVALLEAFIMP
jgi:hypothetical protein